jgi:hypothetical protein
MSKDEIIESLRDMARYPTVTLPRDSEALKAAADLLAQSDRTWVHLTNEEHTELAIEWGCLSADWVFYAAAVERKVKEKNT